MSDASREVLDSALANMLPVVARNTRLPAKMPAGQAILLWLQENMPLTAQKVLAELRTHR